MNELLSQLRSPTNVFYEYGVDNGKLLSDAANEIERLLELVEVYRQAAGGPLCPND